MDIDWTNNKECLEAVKQYGWALKYVNTQTPEICLEAVKQNGYGLAYVNNQTPLIVAHAIVQNKHAKQFIKIDWTDELEREIFFLTI